MEYTLSELNITAKELEVKDQDSVEISIHDNDIYSELFNRKSFSSFEDSGSFLRDLFVGKETVLNENWKVNENIQGKIINVNDKHVWVDCLIDSNQKIFQSRSFPKELFTHLTNLKSQKPVLIKTKLKPGSIRIDVYPGDGIVDLEAFEVNENWESLRGKDLGSKLNEW